MTQDQPIVGVRFVEAGAIAYCAQGSLRTALLAMAAGYRQRVGFDTSAGRWLYTRRTHYRANRHHAERLLRLGAGDDAAFSPEDLRPSLFPGPTERSAVDALLGAAQAPLIALAPGSIWATKRWPGFADLARRLRDTGRLVIVGSGDDRPLAQEIVAATGGAALDAT